MGGTKCLIVSSEISNPMHKACVVKAEGKQVTFVHALQISCATPLLTHGPVNLFPHVTASLRVSGTLLRLMISSLAFDMAHGNGWIRVLRGYRVQYRVFGASVPFQWACQKDAPSNVTPIPSCQPWFAAPGVAALAWLAPWFQCRVSCLGILSILLHRSGPLRLCTVVALAAPVRTQPWAVHARSGGSSILFEASEHVDAARGSALLLSWVDGGGMTRLPHHRPPNCWGHSVLGIQLYAKPKGPVWEACTQLLEHWGTKCREKSASFLVLYTRRRLRLQALCSSDL